MAQLKRLDPIKNEKGIEVPFPLQPEIRLCLARMNNPVMQRWMRFHGPERKRQLLAQGLSSDAAADQVFMEAVANTVVLGWPGLDGADGQPLPCTPEAVLGFLQDELLPHFKEAVYTISSETNRYFEQEHEAAAKNSEPA